MIDFSDDTRTCYAFTWWEDTKFSKYFSTLSRPQSSLTTGMVAGTSNRNDDELSEPVAEENSIRAAIMASLAAEWIELARTKGGSPEAAWKNQRIEHQSWTRNQMMRKWFLCTQIFFNINDMKFNGLVRAHQACFDARGKLLTCSVINARSN